MAVLQTIRNLLVPLQEAEPEDVVPAPPMEYSVVPITSKHLKEVLRLNLRCFENGDNYTKHTFTYLLNEPNILSYRAVSEEDETVGFIFVMVNDNGAAHLTTIGIAPEHRRRGLAHRLLAHAENALKIRNVGTIMLEVRVSNYAAQNLYNAIGYTAVQRIVNYYNNGEDCFLMMKPIT